MWCQYTFLISSLRLTSLTSVPIKSIPIPKPQLFNLKSFSALQPLNNCHPKAIFNNLEPSPVAGQEEKRSHQCLSCFVVCLAVFIDRQPVENLFLFNSMWFNVIQCIHCILCILCIERTQCLLFKRTRDETMRCMERDEKKLLLDKIINQNCLSFCWANSAWERYWEALLMPVLNMNWSYFKSFLPVSNPK